MRISDWSSDVCSSDLSIVALSVSISASRSPDLTVSPSFTSHLARVPSSIVGERAGIFNSIGMSRLVPVSLAGGACRYGFRSEEHTSELQSLMRISYAVFCLKKKTKINHAANTKTQTSHNTYT